MTETDIEGIIAAQAALIAALDAGDVASIEATTATLSRMLSAVQSSGAATRIRHDRVDHALRQTDAARTRVNYLADRNRQRLDRLAERRGAQRPSTYNAAGRFAVFGG